MSDVEPENAIERRVLASPPSPVERERSLARKAARQYGTIGHDQLLDLGFSESAIRYRIRCGRLRRVHRGVYAFGAQPLTQIGHWYAALLASRPDPALSHTSSLAKMGLARERNGIHVTVNHRRGRNLRGVTVHRCRSIDPDDLTRLDGIPVTSLPRTLIDVAETEGAAFVAKVLEEADRRRLLDPAAIHACAARSPGRRGLATLLPLVAEYVPTPNAKEGLEREFQLFLRERGLPAPEVNVLVHGHLVDCWWPDQRVVVELDSRTWHEHWDARERDFVRDSTLQRHDIRPIRVTDRRLTQQRDDLEADLWALLGPT
jgi:very-short-patch-repair endonuclease